MKNFAILAFATILAACGNDPVTYAGYFDEDQDKSVTTNNNSNGDQVFNNYGSGNMNVTNNTGDTYIQYDKSIENTISSLSFSYNPGTIIGFLTVTNLTADTVWISGTYRTDNGYIHQLVDFGSYEFIPPFGYMTTSEYTGGKCVTVTQVTFLKQEIDRSVSCCPRYNYTPVSIWSGAIKLGNCK